MECGGWEMINVNQALHNLSLYNAVKDNNNNNNINNNVNINNDNNNIL